HVHHHDGDVLLEVGGALGGEGLAMAGSVLVGGADQLDDANQAVAFLVTTDLDLDGVEVCEVGRYHQRRLRRRPDGRGHGPISCSRLFSLRALNRSYVDLRLSGDLHLGYGAVAGRERPAVQLLGDAASPKAVKTLPAQESAGRVTEMVAQRHKTSWGGAETALVRVFYPFANPAARNRRCTLPVGPLGNSWTR